MAKVSQRVICVKLFVELPVFNVWTLTRVVLVFIWGVIMPL